MYQISNVKLPFQNDGNVSYGNNPDVEAKDIRNYIERYILSKTLFSPEASSVNAYKDISRFDTSFLENVVAGKDEYVEFFNDYVKPFLRQNAKSQDPKEILNYYNQLKDRVKKGNLKYVSQLPKPVNSREGAKSYIRKFLVDPGENLNTNIGEWDRLSRQLEDEGQYIKSVSNIRRASLEDIQDIVRSVRGSDVDNIEDAVLGIENANRAGASSDKLSVPVKLSIDGINDINQKPFKNPLDYYTVLSNIPLETEITPEVLSTLVKDEHYYPESDSVKKELKLFSNLSDDIDVDILDVDEDSIEKIYPLNQSQDGSVYDEANKFEQNFSVEDYLSYLKDPENITMTSPDDLESMRSNADEIVEIPKSIFTARTNEVNLDRRSFLEGALSESGTKKREAFDRLYNSLDLDQQIDKIYVGDKIIKSIEKGNIQSIRKYFVSDENGNIDRISESGLNKALGRGIRYEHIVPIKVLGELVGTLYNNMQEGGDFDENKFFQDAKNLVERLYTIAWIDRDEDNILTKSGLRETMGPTFEREFKQMALDGELDNQEEDEIVRAILSRYSDANVQQNIKKLNDLYGGSNSIGLSPIKNKQLRPKIDPKSGDIRVRESKKPALTGLLFGYYG